jgi:hypothetical protein
MKQLTPIELLIIDLHILKLKGRNPAIEEVISIAENYLVKDKDLEKKDLQDFSENLNILYK